MTASLFLDYFRLTKPRLMMMAALTTFTGFYMAPASHLAPAGRMFHATLGAWLVGGGANALNQYFERSLDARMVRTQNRPLPAKRIGERGAFLFGAALSIAGVLELFVGVNAVAGWIGLGTLAAYLLCYTPLKTRTPLNTLVGAVSGAAPALIGWAGAQGHLAPGAWALFSFIFIWQLPHFLAIAWVYRQDYLRGGFRMVSAEDATGLSTGKGLAALTTLLIASSFAPAFAGITGLTYLFMAIFCGCFIMGFTAYIAFSGGVEIKRFIPLSITYLFLLNLTMILDKA